MSASEEILVRIGAEQAVMKRKIEDIDYKLEALIIAMYGTEIMNGIHVMIDRERRAK